MHIYYLLSTNYPVQICFYYKIDAGLHNSNISLARVLGLISLPWQIDLNWNGFAGIGRIHRDIVLSDTGLLSNRAQTFIVWIDWYVYDWLMHNIEPYGYMSLHTEYSLDCRNSQHMQLYLWLHDTNWTDIPGFQRAGGRNTEFCVIQTLHIQVDE